MTLVALRSFEEVDESFFGLERCPHLMLSWEFKSDHNVLSPEGLLLACMCSIIFMLAGHCLSYVDTSTLS
jgi:hypothetical protein